MRPEQTAQSFYLKCNVNIEHVLCMCVCACVCVCVCVRACVCSLNRVTFCWFKLAITFVKNACIVYRMTLIGCIVYRMIQAGSLMYRINLIGF